MTLIEWVELIWLLLSAVVTVCSVITKLAPDQEDRIQRRLDVTLQIIKKLALNK